MSGSTDKRAHHNALERKRRDHIKDSFTNLRDCIPAMSGEKVTMHYLISHDDHMISVGVTCSYTKQSNRIH